MGRKQGFIEPCDLREMFNPKGVSIIGVFTEKPLLNCWAQLPPFWNFKYMSCELSDSNKFRKNSMAQSVLIVYQQITYGSCIYCMHIEMLPSLYARGNCWICTCLVANVDYLVKNSQTLRPKLLSQLRSIKNQECTTELWLSYSPSLPWFLILARLAIHNYLGLGTQTISQISTYKY